MKLRQITTNIMLVVVTLGLTSAVEPLARANPIAQKYICSKANAIKVYTTYAVISPSESRPIIRWNAAYFNRSGWNARERCEEVTKRFNDFAKTGELNYLTTGILNGYPVICVVTSYGSPCAPDSLLFTLKRGENASAVIQQLFNVSTGASSNPLWQSGDSGTVYIKMDDLLNSIQPESVTDSDSPSTPSSGAETSPNQPPKNPSNGGLLP